MAAYATAAAFTPSDSPPGVTRAQLATLRTVVSRTLDVEEVLPLWAPSRVGDAAFSRWLTRYMRMGAGVGGAAEIVRRWQEIDLREVLPQVAVPTLVLHRRGDRAIDPGNARYLAERMPHARLALVPGEDTILWAGDVDPIAAELEAWLHGLGPAPAGRPGAAGPPRRGTGAS
ncbi:MAG TPA: hypothetical protein VF486_04755 [Actinomycetes bacterium]